MEPGQCRSADNPESDCERYPQDIVVLATLLSSLESRRERKHAIAENMDMYRICRRSWQSAAQTPIRDRNIVDPRNRCVIHARTVHITPHVAGGVLALG